MKNIITRIYRNKNVDLGSLLLRLVLGILFVTAGWVKVTHPEFAAGFVGMGFSTFQYHLVAWVELIGGILVILGLLLKPATNALAVIMAVVVWGAVPDQANNIFWGNNSEFVLFATLIALYFIGAGKYSIAGWRESRRQN